MYVLAAILVALVVYAVAVPAARATGRAMPGRGSIALFSLAFFVAALVAFNLASRAVGINLGPFEAVSYSIPDDYLARGAAGVLALVPYSLACTSPAFAVALASRPR